MHDSISNHFKSEQVPRLLFIDMARSMAIILMLEGHFTGAALANEYRDNKYILYNIWHNIHGLTSPLFFTVTGVIFVYLISGNNSISFFKNYRVKKGFKRVLELLFWGYFIQLDLWSICKSIYYGTVFHLEWFYAFHVLQSIGFGIFFLLAIYGIFKWLNKGALYWYYLVSGLLLFIVYGYMKNYIQMDEQAIANGLQKGPKYFPHNAPAFIQNMFYGKYSDFSFIRYSGYTILGGMLGSIIRTYENKTKEWWFGATFLIIGIIISIFIQEVFRCVDNFTEWIGITKKGFYGLNATAFIRFGQAVSVLGIFMLIDKYFNVKAKLYLKLGQNTLPIYVVHVILLYGGIFGIGLKLLLFDENLSPLIVAVISAGAILFFTLMAHYIEILEDKYKAFIRLITFQKKK